MVLSLVSAVSAANLKEIDTTGNMTAVSADSLKADGSKGEKEVRNIGKLTDGAISGETENGQGSGGDTFSRADWCIDTEAGQYVKVTLEIKKPVDFSGIRIYGRKGDDVTAYAKGCLSEIASFEFYDAAGNSVKTAEIKGVSVSNAQYADFAIMSESTSYTVSGATKIVINITQLFGVNKHWGCEEIKLTTGASGTQKKTVAELKKLGFKAPDTKAATNTNTNTNTGTTTNKAGEIDTVGNMVVQSAQSIKADGSVNREVGGIAKLTDGSVPAPNVTGQSGGADTFARGDWCIDTPNGMYVKVVLTIKNPVDFSGIRIYGRRGDEVAGYAKGCLAEIASFEFYDAAGKNVKTAEIKGTGVAPGNGIEGTQYTDFAITSGNSKFTVSGVKKIVINITQLFGENKHWGCEEIKLTSGAAGAQKKTVAELAALGFKSADGSANTGNTGTGADGEIDTTGNMVVESAKSIKADGSVNKEVASIAKLTDGEISDINAIGQEGGRDTFARGDWCIDTEAGTYVKVVLNVKKPVEFSGIRIYVRKGDEVKGYKKAYAVEKATVEFYDAKGNSVQTAELTGNAVEPGGGIEGTQYVDFAIASGSKIYSVTDATKIVINITQLFGQNKHWGSEEIKLTNLKSGEKKTVAELKTLGFEPPKNASVSADAKYVDKTGWTVTANSARPGGSGADAVIDNNQSTFWHSNYEVEDGKIVSKDDAPFDLDVTLSAKTAVSGISILPRQDTNGSGIPTKVQYFALIDGEYKDLGTYDYPLGKGRKTESFKANLEITGLRVRIIDGNAGYGTLAEIDLLPANKDYKTLAYDAFIENENANRLYKIDKKDTVATFDGDHWSLNVISRTVDGNDSTFFQAGTAKYPFTFVIDVDLGREYTLSAFSYFPRQTDDDGFWHTYKILAGTDGTNYTEVGSEERPEVDYSRQFTYFETPVKARYFRFEISKGSGNLVSCAELDFYENYENYIKRTETEREEYKLVIGKNEITHKGGTATLDTAPYIENGTTFIPLRGLLELMGASIEWKDENQSITVKKDTTDIYLQIRNYLVDVTTPKYGTVRYTLLAAPRITDSRTFIPIRFVSEQLGYDVEWDGATQTVTITK